MGTLAEYYNNRGGNGSRVEFEQPAETKPTTSTSSIDLSPVAQGL